MHGPCCISGPSLVRALHRLQIIRSLEISLPSAARILPSRIASLARFANIARATAFTRLNSERRFATLAAFVHCLEAPADLLRIVQRAQGSQVSRGHARKQLRISKTSWIETAHNCLNK